MNTETQMVMFLSKKLHISEWSVIACSVFYNAGKYWLSKVFKEDVDEEYDKYIHGIYSRNVEDFCLDYLANRIPPNLLVNALHKQCDKSKTQVIKVRHGK